MNAWTSYLRTEQSKTFRGWSTTRWRAGQWSPASNPPERRNGPVRH
ncbi:hypothetical protein clg_25 [Corynebacterium phage CL31]|nr:hypothetical protein clg_25 [Corynebacterium phage CL31]